MSLESKRKGIEELRRVLKPNKQILIIAVGEPISVYSKFIGFFLRWIQEFKSNLHGEVIELLNECGFKIIFVRNTVRLVGTINITLAENGDKIKDKA